MDLSAPTSPSDCGLAVAVPLDRDEFLAALRPGSRRDFPRWYAAQHGGAARVDTAVWESFREREGEQIMRLANEVRSLGVQVVFDCRLEDFAQLCRRKTVVTLLAHWHSGDLQREHITNRSEFLHRLRRSEHPVVRRLYAALPVRTRDLVEHLSAGTEVDTPDLDDLLLSVNTVLRALDLTRVPTPLRAVWPSPADHTLEANRDALYAAMPDVLADATGVDFHDGARRADDIAAALPADYAGLLELAVCGSMFLAEDVKRRHPSCNVIANRGLTTILFRVLLYVATIREISKQSAPYAQSAQHIRVKLWDSLSRS